MLSLPEGWNYTAKGLVKIRHEGTDSIHFTLKKLERSGYGKPDMDTSPLRISVNSNEPPTIPQRIRSFGAVLVIYLLCFLFRVCEYFILRTDQTFWGEAFVHKLIGTAILCITVKMTSFTFEEIGFSKANIIQNFLKGLLFGLSVFAFAMASRLLSVFCREILSRCNFMLLHMPLTGISVIKQPLSFLQSVLLEI